MASRKKRVKALPSDDSENSAFESKGQSSSSDVPILESLKKLRQAKKVNPEDYDGDCELDRNDKNRVKKTATRSTRVLKQRTENRLLSDGSSSTPVTMPMDVDDCFGFEKLMTPAPCSPVPRFRLSTTPEAPTSPDRTRMGKAPAVVSPTPVFETPLDKPAKRTKRKRVTKNRRTVLRPSKQEEAMLAQFLEVESHELVIE